MIARIAILMDWSFLSTQKISQVYYQHFLDRCYFCRIKSTQLVCQHCLHGFTLNESYCQTCKLPTPKPINLCGECQKKPPQYQTLFSPLIYQGHTKTLITGLKFSSKYQNCQVLCHFLVAILKKHYQQNNHIPWPQALIPVPSHINRVRQRGFCHMNLLSRNLLAQLAIELPLQNTLLVKSEDLAPQHDLNKTQRHKLKANSFNCPNPVPSHVALFDDVITTGSTIDACISKLKEAGATQVDVWSLARTPAKGFEDN